MRRISSLYSDLVQRVRAWDGGTALAALAASQWHSEEQADAMRLRKLRELLRHCHENVPFYRSAFEAAGLDPGAVAGARDLSRLPVISKSTLRRSYDQFRSRSPELRHDIWVSSGSTGEPFAFRLDKNAIAANTFAAYERAKSWWGFENGMREVMIWSGVRDISGTIAGRCRAWKRRVSWRLKGARLFDVYSMTRESSVRAYHEMVRFKPVLMRAISMGMLRFCEHLDRAGFAGSRIGLRGAIFTGEGLNRRQRAFIEGVLGCPTISEYGCTELGLIAFECPHLSLHVNDENHVLECLRDGEPALPGEQGELVVTDLNNYAFPLVRYSVGDLVVPSGEKCPCGRRMPVLQDVCGRSHDHVYAADGSVVHGLFFTHLFDRIDDVARFRVVQRKVGSIRIELIGGDRIPEETLKGVERTACDAMGIGGTAEVVQVDEIPAARSGKTPWIISEVDRPETA